MEAIEQAAVVAETASLPALQPLFLAVPEVKAAQLMTTSLQQAAEAVLAAQARALELEAQAAIQTHILWGVMAVVAVHLTQLPQVLAAMGATRAVAVAVVALVMVLIPVLAVTAEMATFV